MNTLFLRSRGLPKRALICMIRFYRQYVSPQIGQSCRFYPTCSQYALTAIERYGAVRGTLMAVMRLLKCHPFHPGGYDPVPEGGADEAPHEHASCPSVSEGS